ncbi:phospholipase D-like domain-containing protein [Nibribacter koreensis]|uniref:phospholipase D n=1 Tax=Nibribacter koreensis TaxID=1084519 RepID=A0ABP8FFQ2_9BACT
MSLNSFFSPSSTKIKNGVYFSPGEECLNAIISFILAANASLKICVFTISDDRITRAILQAYQRGIAVELLTDNEKLFDKGSDIRELAMAGIEIRVDNTPNHMHHKYAVIDQKHVLTGSYNWTRSAALYNHENVLVSSDPQLVKPYLIEFDTLWAEMVAFEG